MLSVLITYWLIILLHTLPRLLIIIIHLIHMWCGVWAPTPTCESYSRITYILYISYISCPSSITCISCMPCYDDVNVSIRIMNFGECILFYDWSYVPSVLHVSVHPPVQLNSSLISLMNASHECTHHMRYYHHVQCGMYRWIDPVIWYFMLLLNALIMMAIESCHADAYINI